MALISKYVVYNLIFDICIIRYLKHFNPIPIQPQYNLNTTICRTADVSLPFSHRSIYTQ